VAGLGVVGILVAVIAAITALHAGWFDVGERAWSLERRPSQMPTPAEREVAPPASPSLVTTTPSEAAAVSVEPDVGEPTSSLQSAVDPRLALGQGRTAMIRESRPRSSGAASGSAVAQGPRFAVEFGPFVTGVEAARTEQQINEAGHQTVRFRQQTGASLYAVLIEQVSSTRAAQALVATLREQGLSDPVVLSDGDTLSVRVGEPMLLRAAVQLGASLRAKNHQIRVASQPGEAQTFVIRHGNFASREEAEARGVELERLGLPNHVVRAK
jgi:hypothetical protein